MRRASSVFAMAGASLLALAALFLASGESATVVRGSIAGRATLVTGSAQGPIATDVKVSLPPGGGWSGPFAFSLAEGRVQLSGSAVARCSGTSVGESAVFAACATEINDLSVVVDGSEVLRASGLVASVDVRSDGGEVQVESRASHVQQLCVFDTAGACTPVAIQPGVASPFATGLASGVATTVVERKTDPLKLPGNGRAVTALDVSLQTPALGGLSFRFGTAEAFLANAGVCTLPAVGTATPTFTPTPRPSVTPDATEATPPDIPTPTPTCPPRAGAAGRSATPSVAARSTLAARAVVGGLAADGGH